MEKEVKVVQVGLALVLVGLLFGVGMGISFGIQEKAYKNYVAAGIAANPEIHDAKSQDKIWRYAQRAHFHATGIAAFSLGLVILVMLSTLKTKLKRVASIFIGLSCLYPLSWFTMFVLAPSMGRGPAHGHILTEIFALTGVSGLLMGVAILCANLFLGRFKQDANT